MTTHRIRPDHLVSPGRFGIRAIAADSADAGRRDRARVRRTAIARRSARARRGRAGGGARARTWRASRSSAPAPDTRAPITSPSSSVPQPGGTRLVVYPDIPDNVVSRLSFQWPIYTAGRIDALERAAIAEARPPAPTSRRRARICVWKSCAPTGRRRPPGSRSACSRNPWRGPTRRCIDARNRFEVGLIPPNEVSSLEAQRSRERAQLIEAANIRESALIELRRLIGAPPDHG